MGDVEISANPMTAFWVQAECRSQSLHQHVSVPIGDSPHPPGLPTIWKGRHVSELVAGLGEPDMILETTVRGFAIYDSYAVSSVYCCLSRVKDASKN
jgi:hypothetical protein